jgi:hypothetical protein
LQAENRTFDHENKTVKVPDGNKTSEDWNRTSSNECTGKIVLISRNEIPFNTGPSMIEN